MNRKSLKRKMKRAVSNCSPAWWRSTPPTLLNAPEAVAYLEKRRLNHPELVAAFKLEASPTARYPIVCPPLNHGQAKIHAHGRV